MKRIVGRPEYQQFDNNGRCNAKVTSSVEVNSFLSRKYTVPYSALNQGMYHFPDLE
ncbi:MAG: hypothetical protein JWM11_2989 [Planctomycetaceae bacterium]|nr:hypothetical protein [Planctomycetaceae bacterium]